ncbi:MAG: permease-like cell division protein FtsX [Bacteroidetes bacterium]|nr:permease-like cell division protein FtsX [Bacteroidota bacterium]
MATESNRRRIISYLPAFLSISMVMFLAGLFGIFLMHVSSIKKEIKENILLSVYFKDEVKQADILRLQKELEAKQFVLKAEYISKEQGLKYWKDDLGKNPQDLLGFNPFPNSLDVKFKEEYVNDLHLNTLKKQLEENLFVREVSYDVDIVKNIDHNIRMIGLILLSISLLMIFVSLALINNTIRLTLYSKRFLIKSMQYVGATWWFIRRPFIMQGVILGLASGLFACTLLATTLSLVYHYFPVLNVLDGYLSIIVTLFVITITGMFISGVSSYFALNRYLRMKLDDLF